MKFVHLQVKSNYSLLSSLCSVKDLVGKAHEYGYTSIALTDHNVMYGTIEFYKECIKNEIKPIIGLTVDIKDENTYQLLLLAKNNLGYKNLLKISSHIKLNEGFITIDDISRYSSGLIAITPGRNGQVESYLYIDEYDKAINILNKYKEIFKELYLGINYHGLKSESKINKDILSLSNNTNTPVVLLNEVSYLNKDDGYYLEYAKAIKEGRKIADFRNVDATSEYYLKTPSEMSKLNAPKDAFINTLRISESCNVNLSFDEIHLPKYPTPKNVNSDIYLRELCIRGLKKRYGNELSDIHKERLMYELDIIKKMNFSDYFLVVWDFIKYAKQNDVLVGPGRGSAAGSLVSYTLGITNVDPIKYDLLFERFLNPERITMPDIDIDFPDNRRDDIIEYVKNKYGSEYVAQIITFGTLGAKQAIRDVGRVMDIPIKRVDDLSKAIPHVLNINLLDAYKESNKVRQIVNESVEMKKLYEIAIKLEGMPRHTSTHAAGIVMSDVKLTDVIPLDKGSDLSITQFSMKYLEELGLIKMDFLGLRNLTILNHIVKLIKTSTNDDVDINKIPLDDNKTFKLITSGNTTGIFQLESSGMRSVLRKMRPSHIEDIVAANALYRPGPMENIPSFIKRKHHHEKVEYIHDDIKDILEPTYGIIVYQEQIMKIAQRMAGYSLGDADILRRAIGKKIKSVLESERNHFVKGCLNNNYDNKTANEVFDLIVKFANYGFNRSHSVAYSMIGYQLAYLKANYPLFFMSALLSSVIGSEVKISEYIRECTLNKINILGPSINKSHYLFKVENNSIRFSLASIKSVGVNACKQIIKEREENGPFKDFFDFVIRVYSQSVNKRTIESLIDAGAFNEFGYNKMTLQSNVDKAIDFADISRVSGEGNLFIDYDIIGKPEMHITREYSNDELLTREKNALGLYLTKHPTTKYKESEVSIVSPIEYKKYVDKNITSIIYVHKQKEIKTKKGDLMAFITGSDELGESDYTLFPDVYKKINTPLKGKVLKINGKVEYRLGNLQVIVKNVKLF